MADAGKIVITPKGKYNSTTTYEWLDEVTYDGKSYIALKTVTGVTPSDDGVNWRLFLEPNDIVAGNLVPTFTEASTRSNIISEENLSTILGKVKKYFTDLKGHAFNDTVKNLTTEETGSALDASQGKLLKDEVDGVNSNLSEYKDNGYLPKNLFNADNYGHYIYSITIGSDLTQTSSDRYGVSGMLDGSKDITVSIVTGEVVALLWGIKNNKIAYYNDFALITSKTYKGGQYDYWVVGFGLESLGTITSDIMKNNKCMVEYGSSATNYVPYFNSVSDINESLANYGLDNKSNKSWVQGVYGSAGTLVSSYNYGVADTNYHTCSSDNIVSVKMDNLESVDIVWYNGTTMLNRVSSSATNGKAVAVAPTNTTQFLYSVRKAESGDALTPNNVKDVYLYVGNEIDSIKKDLSDVKTELLCEELQITGVNDNIYIVNNNSFVKNGVAFVDILFSELSNINEDTTLFTINKPKFSLYYNHYDYEFTIAVNKDGQVIASKLINSKDVRFQAIYPIE